ncbi:two-component sensor histidine kinase [Paenibacillus baekrokdamisoli]|uniref:histidine kinase n=1 Tax=Paenibacillus baekrokdamisoli TaxID=1712516 RepID=A0A3G9JA31_9BACL|nr:HAMP domain-containing sensor histidine kinase [Paenibacillus baekrokdamisoli]MBB3069899.1 two-component system OmpR family sensor kinase [Paenibacillus baekrokdamisoli]BBH20748.1 two-component sensor histidine kinase [Paenibacillus baekrokdamisoli]
MINHLKRFSKTVGTSRSLRSQLLTRSLFILAVLLLLIGLLQYYLMKDFLYRSKAESMHSQIMTIPKDLFNNSDQRPYKKPQDNEAKNDNSHPNRPLFLMPDTSIAIIHEDGTVTDAKADNGIPVPVLSKEAIEALISDSMMNRGAGKQTKYKLMTDAEGTEQLVILNPLGPPNNSRSSDYIQMGSSTAPITTALMQQLLIFLFLSLLALAGGFALYIPVLRRTLIPLSRMISTVEQIDSGKLDERFPHLQGQEEIDRLSRSFNGMLERLETSFEAEKNAMERMRQFVADASHELRTPLTSIHGFLEVLLRGAASKPEQLQSALTSMHGESKRINKLVEDLLVLAKFDQDPQLHRSDLSLTATIREMQPQLRMLAGNRDVRYVLTEEIHGSYDSDKLKQVILNLFQNAVQHTDPVEGSIIIRLIHEGKQVKLSVRDNGVGINEQHLSRLFERFYRSDQSRGRKYGGAGLGLAISQSIVEAHGGEIKVRSRLGQGSEFDVIFPVSFQADYQL